MNQHPRIGIAIAGCGQIARTRHAPEYAQNPLAVIIGFYDRTPERAAGLAKQYGGKAYTSYEELLADPAVQAVSICTPNFQHAGQTVQALHAGKAVLCEKPMASTLAEADRMLAAQLETGKLLMLGHNQRFVPTHIKAKELIDAGTIGDVLHIQSSFKHQGPELWSVQKRDTWFFSKEAARFGVLGDLGSHKFDLVQYLLGDEIASVSAKLFTLDKRLPDGGLIDLDDNAICVFRSRGGITGTVTVSWTNYGTEDNSTIVYGTRGVMKIFVSEIDDIVIEFRDGSSARYQVGQMSTNTRQLRSGIIDAFLDSIAEGKPAQVTGIDGRNTLACLEAAQTSAQANEWVAVSSPDSTAANETAASLGTAASPIDTLPDPQTVPAIQAAAPI